MAKKSKRKNALENGNALAAAGYNYLHTIAFWGLAVLIFLSPFFRGLFFPENQQVALLFTTLIFWVVWLWKWSGGDGLFLVHPLDWLTLALPLVYLVSSFSAVNVGLAVNEVVKAILYFMVFWSAASLINRERDAVNLFRAICLPGVLVSLAGLATATGLIHIKDGFLNGRIYSTFQYPNALASYLMTVIFLSLYLWLRAGVASGGQGSAHGKEILPGLTNLNVSRYIYILVSFVACTVFVGTKSNGGMLVFFLALALYFAGLPRGQRVPAAFHLAMAGVPAAPCSLLFVKYAVAGKQASAWAWVLAGAVTVIGLQCLYNYLERKGLLEFISRRRFAVIVILVAAVSAAALAGAYYASSNSQAVGHALDQFRLRNAVERTYFYRDALKMIVQRPILGWGGGGWQEAYQAFQGYYYTSRQVHSHYVQIAVEAGVAGLLVILSIWAAFLHLTYRSVRQCSENPGRKMLLWTAFTAAVALGAHAAIDFDLSLSALSLVLWSMWGIMRGLHHPGVGEKCVTTVTRGLKRPVGLFASTSLVCLVLFFAAGSLVSASGSAKDASARLSVGDINGAVLLMERSVHYNPFNSDYNAALSSLYVRQGKIEPALRQSEEAVSKSKYNPSRYLDLSGLLFRMYRTGEAVSAAEKAVQMAPYQVEVYNRLSQIYLLAGYNLTMKGQTAEAAQFLTRATQVEEMINRQANNLGPLEKRLWSVAPMLAPSEYTRLNAGAALCLMGDYQKAEPMLQSVGGDDRTRAESVLWMSYIYNRQGRQSESEALIAQARALVPDLENQFPHVFSLLTGKGK